MRLAKIKNKYFYKDNNPEGTHYYAVYYDKASKRNRAIPLTHLYVKDGKRFEQVKKKFIKVEKFKEFETPSGVWNYFYVDDVNGNKIDLKHADVLKVENRYLSKKQSDRVKSFSKNPYNKKNSHK